MPPPNNAPKWLKDYYGGKDFGLLGPAVEIDGKTHAVVKLQRRASRGYASVGYVLIKKRGKHNASDELSLHEGLASKDDMTTMKKVLEQEDGK
jgi:hypothetical protein